MQKGDFGFEFKMSLLLSTRVVYVILDLKLPIRFALATH